MQKRFTPRILAAALAAMASGGAWASGFALQNQTGSGNGNAFAGAAAAAEDAGTIMWNPAGMVYLPQGHTISLAGTLLDRSLKFTNNGSSAATTPLGIIAPLPTTANGGDAGTLALIPAGYWAYALTPDLRIGIGVSPTFGNKTEYDFDFVGRNAGYFAEIKQVNFNPSIAFKLNEKVSLGFGLDIAYNETHFKQGYPITAAPVPALNSANNFVDLKGDDWSVGYNLGLMFQVSPSTRVGVTYRSTIKFDLEGKYDVNTPVPAAQFVDQDIKATLKTPDSLSLAVSQKLNDRWEMLGDITWTGWSVIDTLVVKNKNTGATITSLSYNFRDTWRIGLGANYHYNDAWKFRFGIAYDRSPVKSAADRTMTLPDSDRTWIAFGAKYTISPKSSLDFGYAHIFFKDASTEREVRSSALGLLQTIRGSWDNTADLLSVQYNHTF
ncbi:OmpP1/FadL family transporter [Sulfuricystis thermophila]|uniref:OmpP1/FadL family transporter n=1 Tax=Sulfuricystis thermophila TaxID=2496847 RepID=UPI0010368545|nr:OmpP1/FadL family transporter [Sulfuricystis thermophila]